jgi:hypothetical protein
MTEREVKLVVDLAKSRMNMTKEEALRAFQRAGIMDEHGEFKPPYENLGYSLAYSFSKD